MIKPNKKNKAIKKWSFSTLNAYTSCFPFDIFLLESQKLCTIHRHRPLSLMQSRFPLKKILPIFESWHVSLRYRLEQSLPSCKADETITILLSQYLIRESTLKSLRPFPSSLSRLEAKYESLVDRVLKNGSSTT